MAFGGSGGFSFGSNNNNNNQSTGFGGFGSSTNNPGAFGSNTSNTGFGSSTAASNPFGSSTFGSNSNTGGFGSNPNTGSSLFGNKSTTANLFGSSTSSNTGGGLFSSNNNTNTNTSGGFGSSPGFGSTANNAFGSNSSAFGGFGSQNKPAFGSNSSSTPLFGQGGAGTTGGFASGAFGSGGSGTALNQQAVPPSDGTASVPFAPTNEKESNNQNNSYQSITFQQPYQKYSFEELRLADYNAGRRFGNGSGQAGAFGSSAFGGFGSSNSGATFGSSTTNNPFGSNTSSSGGLGSNTSTTFGSNTGGGLLFGNKPAGGGLFGQQSSGTSSGGLFGSSGGNTSSSNPFGGGSSSTFGSNSGGGLFGNNQNQNKPSLFGNTNTSNTSTGFSFGNNASSNTGGGLFSNNNQQQQQSSGGLFGPSTQQQQKPSLFGNTTGGGFGSTNTQGQSSSGPFGPSINNTNTGGGLFGNNTASNTGGGLFSNASNNTSGGLFGNQNNNASKPSGLFSGSTFGSANQQPPGGSLFGNSNINTNQSGGGLFSGNSNNPSNSFSFGNNSQNKPAGSLFGNTGTNQSSGLFANNSGGFFGGSMSQPQQTQQQQQDGIKHSSLLDPNPYGQSSIWTGLPAPNLENAKPLVTPLVATQKLKESQAKPPPSLRLNQSRYMTPPRRTGTYGFSYSTYGTPTSAASTPGGNGLSNSMYVSRFSGGSFGRSMGKAASISNLRSQYADSESVLTPGAFAPTASRYSSGSIRRLHIDRNIRSDLFVRPPLPALTAPPATANGPSSPEATPPATNFELAPDTAQKLKKSVSFDRDTMGGETNGELNGESGALVRTEVEADEPVRQDRGQPKEVNGATAPTEQSRSNELAVVPEDRESESTVSKKQPAKVQPLADPQPGDYWMKPTRAEMSKMPRDQLQHFTGFEVGRHGAGKVRFDEPVDLTSIPFDELFVNIIEIHARSVTVYPDASTKPPPGKGLNVPSTISIEHSWPRAKGQPAALSSGPTFDKHLARLKRIPGTTFKSYDPATGVWTFTVPHYTRYGLDYDDDEMDDFSESQLSAPPDSIDQYKTADMSVVEVHSDNDSSRQDDTFSFKQKTVPGGFGRQAVIDDGPDDSLVRSIEHDGDGSGSERSRVSEEEMSDDDMEMAGSYPDPSGPAMNFGSPNKPILKPGGFGTPGKPLLDLDGDWAEQLQRTISPRKQNRDALREAQSKILLDRAYEPIKPRSALQKKDFRTSLDVMNAIFDRPERRTRAGKGQVQAEPDFEFPYAKRAKTFDPGCDEMSESDKAWHDSFKPTFTSTNQLVCASTTASAHDDYWQGETLLGDGAVISISTLKPQEKLNIASLLQHASVTMEKNVSKIEYTPNMPFSLTKVSLPPHLTKSNLEQLYELLHVLFDIYEDEFSYDLTPQQREDFDDRIRKDRVSKFLTQMLAGVDAEKIADAEKQNPLEAAVRCLAKHDVKSACDVLMKSKNYHLSLLVAQIENADSVFQEDMQAQIAAWRGQNTISEMSEDVRAIYELLAGNTTISQGKPSGPVEDRASTFSISDKYGFGWVQAFALSCWYGKVKEGSVGDWVEDFLEKIELKEETATPVSEEGKEHPFWIALKLYASVQKKGRVEKPTLPQALSALAKKWDVSAAFHVFNTVAASLSGQGVRIDRDKADTLAATFAAQLEAKGDVIGAVYALLHLRGTQKREGVVQDLLNRHAAALPNPTSESTVSANATPEDIKTFTLLTDTLKVPVGYIARAKALFARSTHSPSHELRYLILAQELDAAHECLCRRVAPRLVIDEDYDGLKAAVVMFKDVRPQDMPGWDVGGAVYTNFVTVVLGREKLREKEFRDVLGRVRRGLEGMRNLLEKGLGEGAGLEELEERVALREMGKVLADIIDGEEGEGMESQKAILNLPLTADAKMTQARKMGVQYYTRLMATAR